MTLDAELRGLAANVRDRAPRMRSRALLVALSGIDGSGKSMLAAQLAARIEALGLRVAQIGINPWQHPQSVRFGGTDPGQHFYQYAMRFDDLFSMLVRPLVARRSIRLQTLGIRTDRDVYDPLEYRYDDVDVVLVEGILLLQPRFDAMYDLRIWVDCSFDTALRRALARNVERLPEDRLRDDYARIYHAAQRHHFAIDAPQSRADFLLANEIDLA